LKVDSEVGGRKRDVDTKKIGLVKWKVEGVLTSAGDRGVRNTSVVGISNTIGAFFCVLAVIWVVLGINSRLGGILAIQVGGGQVEVNVVDGSCCEIDSEASWVRSTNEVGHSNLFTIGLILHAITIGEDGVTLEVNSGCRQAWERLRHACGA